MTFVRHMRELSRSFSNYEFNEKAKTIISAIQTKMKQNRSTDEGKKGKERIATNFFMKSQLFC